MSSIYVHSENEVNNNKDSCLPSGKMSHSISDDSIKIVLNPLSLVLEEKREG